MAKLPPPPQIVVENQLDQLRQNAETRVAQVIDRVDALEKTAAQTAQTATTAEQAANNALGKVDDAIRQASLRSAAAALISRLENGLPYAGAMAEVADLLGDAAARAVAGDGRDRGGDDGRAAAPLRPARPGRDQGGHRSAGRQRAA